MTSGFLFRYDFVRISFLVVSNFKRLATENTEVTEIKNGFLRVFCGYEMEKQ